MKLFLPAVFLLFPVFLFAQNYTMPVKVNSMGSSNRAPVMHLDRSGNIYISWVSNADANGNGAIMMGISTDGGATFINTAVSADANCNSNFQRSAQFVLDTKSRIHLVWMGNRINNQPDIWYTRSTDRGKTWSKAITVDDADDSSKYAQDFPSIACDSSDNLYVSFLDSREVQRKLATDPQLYFSKSTDGGLTWSVNKKANVFGTSIGGTCSCCTESMASTRDGHIYIVFRSNINNLRDIWLERSYDKGETFEPALKIVTGDWNIDACPVTGPHITLDDSEGAHIVWRDARDDSGMIHLYYSYVAKGSLTTPANRVFDIPGSQSANYPDIALYDHGNYKAIMYETFNYGMRYILENKNTELVRNRALSPNPSSSKSFANVLFSGNGVRFLAWQDDASGNENVYFAKENSSLESSVAVKTNLDFSLYPNPLPAGNTTVHLSFPSSTYSQLTITDVLGKTVFKRALFSAGIISLPTLQNGIYCITLESNGIRSSKMLIAQ